jgi:hypothetical protein
MAANSDAQAFKCARWRKRQVRRQDEHTSKCVILGPLYGCGNFSLTFWGRTRILYVWKTSAGAEVKKWTPKRRYTSWQNNVMTSFTGCIFPVVFLGWANQGGIDGHTLTAKYVGCIKRTTLKEIPLCARWHLWWGDINFSTIDVQITHKLSSYLTENTVGFHYKDQSVQAVRANTVWTSLQLSDVTVGCIHSCHSTIMVRLISVTWVTALGGGTTSAVGITNFTKQSS